MKAFRKAVAFLYNAIRSFRSVFRREPEPVGTRPKANRIPVVFVVTPALRLVIKRELSFGHLTRAAEHVLTDADKQLVLIKVEREQPEFSLVGLEISGARALERKYDKQVRFASPSFPKEKLKPEPHSQKMMDEAALRRKRRVPSIQAADGMLWRGTYPSHLSDKKSCFIVENGIFPTDDIEPYKPTKKAA